MIENNIEKNFYESEESFATLVNILNDWIWQVDTNGAYTYVSPKVKNLLGYTPEELIGKTPFELMPSEEAKRVGEIFQKMVEAEKPFRGIENINLHKDGHKIYLETSGVPIYNSEGNFSGYRGVDRDITEKKNKEIELKEAKEKYHQLFEKSPVGISLVDLKGVIKEVNPAAQRILGFDRENIIGKNYLEVSAIPQEDMAKSIEDYKRLLKGEALPAGIARLKNHLGEYRWISTQISLIKINGESIMHIITDDVTEKKEAEKELKRVQEQLLRKEKLAAVGKLAGSVSHDLRNPLGVIGNSAYFLNMKLRDADDKIKKHLNILQNEVKRANTLIGDLLEYSRIKEPKLIITNVNKVIRMVINETDKPENIEINVQLNDDIPSSKVDPEKLRRVFVNLITNAYQAMPDGGKLTLKSELADGYVKIAVQDTGVGISDENLKKLFEPLFSTKAKGIGLGLAISWEIIEAHKGRISVESKQGKGTTFFIELPLKKDEVKV